MTEQAPDWALAVPAVGVHNPPPRVPGPDLLQITWQQMQTVIASMVNEFMRQVAVALGAIEIFGFKPYEALVEIGENIQAGVDNFNLLLTAFGLPTIDDVANLLADQAADFASFLVATGQATFAALGAALSALIAWLSAIPANLLSGALPTSVTLSGTQLGTLLQYLDSSGRFAAAQLIGGINTAVTFGGVALSTVLGNLNSSGQFAASALTGALNTGLTFSGTALSTLFQYLNGSGQFNAAQLTGGLNTAVTFGGTALSTLLQYLNSSGQFAAANLTGAINGAVTLGGVSLTNLLQNLNSSGQLAGSAITGAINTAATIGGTALSTLSTNWNAAVTNVSSLISNVGGSTIADVNTFLNAASTNAQGSLNAIVNGINNSAVTGQSIVQAQTAVNNFISGVVNNLQGIAGTFGLTGTTSANAAFAAAAEARARQAADLTQQQSAFNAVFNVSPSSAGNVNQTIDFTAIANQTGMSGIMSPGSSSGAGYMGVTSGEAKWQGGTGDDTEVFPVVTTSDYQVITMTLGSLNDLLGGSTRVHVIGRCNSARDTHLSLHLFFNGTNLTAYLNAVVSGVSTPLSNNTVAVSTGSVIRVIWGDPSSLSPYALQVLHNNSPLITFTDSSHISQLGASYRYVGLRMASSASGKYPPGVRTVSYQDNPPPPSSYPYSGLPTAGTKGRMYWPNDVGVAKRDNGTAWETVWGGVLGAFTEPPSSGWSWVNQGGASIATALGGEFLTAPVGAGNNWRLRARALSPASNYTATTFIEALGKPGSSSWYAGLVLRNASSGSFISFGIVSDVTTSYVTVTRWTNLTTFNAHSITINSYQINGPLPNWFRIRDDGTNRYFEYSLNGVDWWTAWSEGRTVFITPDQFCFGANSAATGDVKIRLRSLAGIA